MIKMRSNVETENVKVTHLTRLISLHDTYLVVSLSFTLRKTFTCFTSMFPNWQEVHAWTLTDYEMNSDIPALLLHQIDAQW